MKFRPLMKEGHTILESYTDLFVLTVFKKKERHWMRALGRRFLGVQ